MQVRRPWLIVPPTETGVIGMYHGRRFAPGTNDVIMRTRKRLETDEGVVVRIFVAVKVMLVASSGGGLGLGKCGGSAAGTATCLIRTAVHPHCNTTSSHCFLYNSLV